MRRSTLVILAVLISVAMAFAFDRKPLTIEDCIEMAARNNPAIHAAKWSGQSAEYKRKAALANFFPVFDAQYSYTWLDEAPTFEIPATPGMTVPGGTQNITLDLSSMGFPPVTVPVTFPDTVVPGSTAMELPAGDDEIESATVTVTQPLFTGGAIYQGYKLSQLQEKMARLKYVDANAEVLYQTKIAFYNVLKASEFVRVAEKAVGMGESLRQMTLDFYEVGMIAKNQLLEAEVNLAQMKQNLTTAKTSFDIARTGLALLIGYEDEIIVIGELNVTTMELTLQQCVQNGMKDRPDILIAQIQMEMARRATRLEEAGLTPNVALIGTYTYETGSFSSDEEILSLTLGAEWTFWEWGKKYHNIKSGKSMERAAMENLRFTRDNAILQIKYAYLKIMQAYSNVITSKMAVSSAEENLRVVEARFEQQMSTSFDVLKAQTLYTQAETNLISATADYITARAELERAMGMRYVPKKTEPAAENAGAGEAQTPDAATADGAETETESPTAETSETEPAGEDTADGAEDTPEWTAPEDTGENVEPETETGDDGETVADEEDYVDEEETTDDEVDGDGEENLDDEEIYTEETDENNDEDYDENQ